MAEIGSARELLDSQEFYELMQVYRHSPVSDQGGTVKAFEAIKSWLCDQLSGFLGGETVKRLEAEISDLRVALQNDGLEHQSITRERDRLREQLARLRAQLAVADETIRQWNLQAIQSVEQAVAAERERIMQLLREPKNRGVFPTITIRKEGEEEG